MFTVDDYDKLSKIWDGKASNASDVCASCGACCHNIEKTLFPGEYEYLVAKSGQMNTQWCSVGCLCYSLEAKGVYVKPVICRLFPLDVEVTLDGTVTVAPPEEGSSYSNKCSSLVYSKEDLKKAKEYFDFLFSDVHNRVFYLLTFSAEAVKESEKEYLAKLGAKVSPSDMFYRCALRAFGIPIAPHVKSFAF